MNLISSVNDDQNIFIITERYYQNTQRKYISNNTAQIEFPINSEKT